MIAYDRYGDWDPYHSRYAGAVVDHHFHEYNGKDGYYIQKFLVDDTVNLMRWGMSWPTIADVAPSFKGKPMVLTPGMDHPVVGSEAPYTVGSIIDVSLRADAGIVSQISRIDDRLAIDAIANKRVRFGSIGGKSNYAKTYIVRLRPGQKIPALKDTPNDMFATDEDINRSIRAWRTGEEPPALAEVIREFAPYHDALVSEPAYGRDKDYIKGTCSGTQKTCHKDLKSMHAAVGPPHFPAHTHAAILAPVLRRYFSECALSTIAAGQKQGSDIAEQAAASLATDPSFRQAFEHLVVEQGIDVISRTVELVDSKKV